MKYIVYGIGGDAENHKIAVVDSLEEASRIAADNEGSYLLGTNIVDENGNDVEC